MTFKLEDDLDILMTYLHTENEAASSRHAKHEHKLDKEYVNISQGQGKGQNIKSSELLRALR